jgi:hypothetical protein
MNEKFTLRDFFTYFFAGVVILLFTFVNYSQTIFKFIDTHREIINDYNSLIIFFSVPLAYFLGHIVHALDNAMHSLLNLFKKIRLKPLSNLIDYFIRYRINGGLIRKNMSEETFWNNCNELQVKNSYSACEYLYVMQDLFKGLFLASIIFSTISLFSKNVLLGGIYLFLCLLFWLRAKVFTDHFIDSVNRTLLICKTNTV